MTVIRFSRVISSYTFCSGLEAKRTSRLVRMPTRRPGLPLPSTTGMPEMRLAFMTASASASVASGPIVNGFTTMPDSNFLTCRTSSACCSGERLRWMTPRPPACAMAMARRASVTVSMADEMIGMLSSIWRVSRVRISTSPGMTKEWPGCNSTSSKVRACCPVESSMICAMPTFPWDAADRPEIQGPAARRKGEIGLARAISMTRRPREAAAATMTARTAQGSHAAEASVSSEQSAARLATASTPAVIPADAGIHEGRSDRAICASGWMDPGSSPG